MPFPTVTSITTPRLTLRPVQADDLPHLMEVNGDPEVTRFLPYATWASLDDAQAWLTRMETLVATGAAQQLVIVDNTSSRPIGTVLLFKHDEGSRRLELGYALGRNAWGQGVMREAIHAACAHAFSAGIRRIEAEVNPANAASCALLLRMGFTLEGTLRKRWTAKGNTYDTNIYGLLVDEWSAASA